MDKDGYEKEKEFKMLEYYVSQLNYERLSELAMDLLCEKFGIPIKTRNADLIRLWESIGG